MTSFLSLHLSEQRKERLFYLACPGVWVPSSVLHVSCSIRALVPDLPCALLVLGSYMLLTLYVPVPHIPPAFRFLVPQASHILHTLILHVPRCLLALDLHVHSWLNCCLILWGRSWPLRLVPLVLHVSIPTFVILRFHNSHSYFWFIS